MIFFFFKLHESADFSRMGLVPCILPPGSLKIHSLVIPRALFGAPCLWLEFFKLSPNSWGLKNWCLQIVVLEKTLESPPDSKEIKPVTPKGSQPWIFIGRTDVEAEAPVLWPPDVKELMFHWKRPWSWERLRAEGEGGDRGWDGWIASPTQWAWVGTNSGR